MRKVVTAGQMGQDRGRDFFGECEKGRWPGLAGSDSGGDQPWLAHET